MGNIWTAFLNQHLAHGEQFVSSRAAGYVSQQSSCWDMFYINWSIQANLSQCALRKYDCSRMELSTRGAPVEFMYVPQFCACTLSRLCCEYRWPQWAATVGCLEWADVYSPLTECWRIWADMSPWCRLAMLSRSLSEEILWRQEAWATVCELLACILTL